MFARAVSAGPILKFANLYSATIYSLSSLSISITADRSRLFSHTIIYIEYSAKSTRLLAGFYSHSHDFVLSFCLQFLHFLGVFPLFCHNIFILACPCYLVLPHCGLASFLSFVALAYHYYICFNLQVLWATHPAYFLNMFLHTMLITHMLHICVTVTCHKLNDKNN